KNKLGLFLKKSTFLKFQQSFQFNSFILFFSVKWGWWKRKWSSIGWWWWRQWKWQWSWGWSSIGWWWWRQWNWQWSWSWSSVDWCRWWRWWRQCYWQWSWGWSSIGWCRWWWWRRQCYWQWSWGWSSVDWCRWWWWRRQCYWQWRLEQRRPVVVEAMRLAMELGLRRLGPVVVVVLEQEMCRCICLGLEKNWLNLVQKGIRMKDLPRAGA
ncbi:hypothetical protein SSS_09860, partial [Sarcoptes scabiei]